MPVSSAATVRTRRDRCPGAFRPWPARDGLLVRVRLIGGRLPASSLVALAAVSEQFGDGRIHLTGRANLQLRGLPGQHRRLDADVLATLDRTGLLPSRSHELVRNVMVSPQTGLANGRTDLRPVAAELDRRLCGEADLARLPGRFLFVLDDGRGDLVGRSCDLGLVALDEVTAQLRVGTTWGEVIPLSGAAEAMIGLARAFLVARGDGPSAPWHIDELPQPLDAGVAPDPRVPDPTPPLAFGSVPGGRHVAVSEDGLDARAARALAAENGELVVTPWRGVLVPEAAR